MALAAIQPQKPVRRRDRLQIFTLVYVALALLVMLGAITSQNNMLFWLVGVAIGSIIVSGLVAGPLMMGVRLGAVRLPQIGEHGSPVRASAEVVNAGRRRSAYALRVEARLTGPNGGMVSARTGLAVIRPGESENATLEVQPTGRGVWTLTSLRVSTTFPFGLSHKIVVFEPGGTVVVLPEQAAESSPDWPAGDSLDTQKQQIDRAADGDTFALREYQPGDPRRLIAWKPSARAGRLVVREQAGSSTRVIWLRPNASREALAHRTPEAERVVSQTMFLGEYAESRNLRVGLVHPGSRVVSPPGVPGEWKRVVAQLGDIENIGLGGPGVKSVVIDVGRGGLP